MESSENLKVATDCEDSDERTALKAEALAALRETRAQANGHLKKTRFACEVVEEEALSSPEDSKVMQTLRFDKDRIGEEEGEEGEA